MPSKKAEATYQLLPENKIPKLPLPAREWFGQFSVELTCPWAISRALANLKINQELARSILACGQNLLPINLCGG